MLDLSPFIDSVRHIVRQHELGTPGSYARWSWQSDDGSRDLGPNPYGCADAANILYTIGDFPGDEAIRRGSIEALRNFQQPGSGLFLESTHHAIHCTAHCIAALELFDARPRHPLAELHQHLDLEALRRFLDELSWAESPWGASHQGAGLFAALHITGESSPEWENAYFDWLWQEADPATGLWRKGCVRPISHHGHLSLFPHLGGSFHYLFNMEATRRPLRFPEALVETCLGMWEDGSWPLGQGLYGGFVDIDWIYAINRASRQCHHKFTETRAAMQSFMERFAANLLARDAETDETLNDLHSLFGLVCALAELQQALPGSILTPKPLRLVLDRRPFI